jgi:hypothetical protein
MKFRIKILALTFLSSVVIFFSCQKEKPNSDINNLKSKAREWFEQNRPNFSIIWDKNAKNLDWENARYIKLNSGISIIEIPYKFLLTFSNKDISVYRALVFTFNLNKNVEKVNILEGLSDNYTIQSIYKNASASYFQEPKNKIFTVSFILRDFGFKQVGSKYFKGGFEQVGGEVKVHQFIPGKNFKTEKIATCHDWYWVRWYSDGTYDVLAYLFTTCDQEEGGNEIAWANYDNNGNTSGISLPNRRIIDSLQGYPCAQSILAQLPSLNSKTQELFQTFLNINQPVDIVFKPDPSLAGTLTKGRTFNPTMVNGVFTSTVYLNPDLLNKGTKEYILLVLMHESLHGYMDYQWHRLQTHQMDTTEFISQFPIFWDYRRVLGYGGVELAQHSEMAERYIGFLRSMIMSFNPNIWYTHANCLAWEGLQNTTLWHNNIYDTNFIKTVNTHAADTTSSQYHGYGFTRCP